MILFNLKTRNATVLQAIFDLLHHNAKTACFEINKHGIKFRRNDCYCVMDLELEADKFVTFCYNKSDTMYMRVNLADLYQAFKFVKPNDTAVLTIESTHKNNLIVNVYPEEYDLNVISYVNVKHLVDSDVSSNVKMPNNYDKYNMIPSDKLELVFNVLDCTSDDFPERVLDTMNCTSKHVTVSSRNSAIRFSTYFEDGSKKCVEVGNISSPNLETDIVVDFPKYNDVFNFNQLQNISNMSGLAPTVKIYTEQGNPLLFKLDVGTMGNLSIYIHSISKINEMVNETENKVVHEMVNETENKVVHETTTEDLTTS